MTTGSLKELVEPSRWIHSPPWKDYPPFILNDWSRACADAIQSGTVEELQKFRDDYQKSLLAHIKIVEGYLSLIGQVDSDDWGGGSFGPSVAESAPKYPKRLAQIRESLQRHYNSLFPRWKTIDDLEQIVLETVSLPNANLKVLAATHSPPQSWYEESVDPLTPKE